MAGTPAVRALRAAGVPALEHAYPHDPRAASFGEEAATALGLPGPRVLKTLVVQTGGGRGDSGLAIAVLAVDRRLDLGAVAAALGAKRAALADPALAERRTGYVVGGISPLGQRMPHPTVVDEAALVWPTVFVSGGRRGLELELPPADLVRLTSAAVAPITAG